METAGIALGSNLGDRVHHLVSARDQLREIHEGGRGTFRTSAIYETSPVDCAPGTTPFLNAVIEIQTSLPPLGLLDRTQAIERALGRPDEREHHAPRTIDVDLLYLGMLRENSERLIIPHPRWAERRFVLLPLADLRPDLQLPGNPHPVAVSLARLNSSEPEPALFLRQW